MESVGFILRKSREDKGLSIEKVSADTHISKDYIVALEEDCFDKFPGDAYCVGFLTNLARYFKLDSKKLVDLYRTAGVNTVESAQSASNVGGKERQVSLFVVCGIIIFLFVAVILFFTLNGKNDISVANLQLEKVPAGTKYVLEEIFLERQFDEDDVISVHLESGYSDIVCGKVGEDVALRIKSGEIKMVPGQTIDVDLDNDSKQDVRLVLKEINSESRNFILRVDKTMEAPVGTESSEPMTVPVASAVVQYDNSNTIILTSSEKRVFVALIEFNGNCLFCYEIDGTGRTEAYYKSGDIIKLEVADWVKLWMSNAGMLKATIRGHEIFFGKNGEVSSEKIGWEETSDRRYNLTIIAIH